MSKWFKEEELTPSSLSTDSFDYSRDCFKKLINKQFELYESLLTREFDARLNEDFVKKYKEQIEAEKKKLNELIVSLHNLDVKDYFAMNGIFIKKLNDSLLRVFRLNDMLLQEIANLQNLSNNQ